MALAALLLAFLAFTALGGLQPERHLDGEGQLGSTGDPHHHEAMAFDAVKGGPNWTLGYQLCLVQGNQPAVIDSVSPTATVGSGFRILGALVRQFSPTLGHTPILSVDGYPPALPEALHPAVGFSVSTACSRNGPPSSYTELLIGIARGSGTTGGGWRGIDVGYRVGGRHRIVSLGYDIYICGSAVTNAPHLCPSSTPAP